MDGAIQDLERLLKEVGNSEYGTFVLVAPYETFQPIGIAQNNANKGEKIMITIDMDSTQEDLIWGRDYYMSKECTLSTYTSIFYIGKALDSNTLLIKGNK